MQARNVTIFFPIRDSEKDAIRLPSEILGIEWPHNNLRVVVIEGDSKDNTYELLDKWDDLLSPLNDLTVIKYNLGVRKFASVVTSARFAVLSKIFNIGIDEALSDSWTDFVLVMPSDVVFDCGIVYNLVKHNKPHIAPMFWGARGDSFVFYDTWGFRGMDGKNWGHFERGSIKMPTEPFQMKFAGGPAMIRRDVLDVGCRYTKDEVDNGLCRQIWDKGFSVWAAPNVEVYHT